MGVDVDVCCTCAYVGVSDVFVVCVCVWMCVFECVNVGVSMYEWVWVGECGNVYASNMSKAKFRCLLSFPDSPKLIKISLSYTHTHTHARTHTVLLFDTATFI